MNVNSMGDAEPAEALDDPARQKAIFEKAYRRTCRHLENSSGDDVKSLGSVIKDRNETIDAIAAVSASKKQAECGPGCSSCCHQMVVSTPLEIFIIARYILDAKSTKETAAIRERLAQRAALPLDEQSRYGADKPCALLEDNSCSIYEHRPSLCRTMLSMSRLACDASLKSKELNVPFIGEPVVMSFLMQLGIDYALIKAKGVLTEKLEMGRALSIALDDFDTALETWITGKDAFPDCSVDTGGGPSNHDLAEIAALQCGLLN